MNEMAIVRSFFQEAYLDSWMALLYSDDND